MITQISKRTLYLYHTMQVIFPELESQLNRQSILTLTLQTKRLSHLLHKR